MSDATTTNRKWSEKLGWTPAHFGASAFDEHLVAAVQAFQMGAFLAVTGVCDDKTWAAYLDREKGKEVGADRARREANLARMGSLERVAPGDPRIAASEPFTGRSLWLNHRAWDLAEVSDRLLSAQECDGLKPRLVLPIGMLAEAQVATEEGRNIDVLVRMSPTRADMHEVEGFLPWLAGAVLDSAGLRLWRPKLIESTMRAAERLPCRVAVAADLRPRGTSKEIRDAWKGYGEADAAMPPVPGPWSLTSAVEYQAGQTLATWKIFTGLTAKWIFPRYVPPRYAAAEHVHRFRAFLNSRSVRGMGLEINRMRQQGADELLAAFVGPLPDKIRRVDRRTEMENPDGAEQSDAPR